MGAGGRCPPGLLRCLLKEEREKREERDASVVGLAAAPATFGGPAPAVAWSLQGPVPARRRLRPAPAPPPSISASSAHHLSVFSLCSKWVEVEGSRVSFFFLRAFLQGAGDRLGSVGARTQQALLACDAPPAGSHGWCRQGAERHTRPARSTRRGLPGAELPLRF